MDKDDAITAKPLRKRFKKRGDKQRFANDLSISIQSVTNWLSRGVPSKELPRVANWCGLTVEQYLRESGVDVGPAPLPMTSRVEGPMYEHLLEYWERLPPKLQEAILHVLKLAATMDTGRRGADGDGEHPRRRKSDDIRLNQ